MILFLPHAMKTVADATANLSTSMHTSFISSGTTADTNQPINDSTHKDSAKRRRKCQQRSVLGSRSMADEYDSEDVSGDIFIEPESNGILVDERQPDGDVQGAEAGIAGPTVQGGQVRSRHAEDG